MKRILALAASLLLGGQALAHEVTVGDLQIIHASIPQPAASAKAAGGFMAIVNNGTETERLIGIESDIAMKAEPHESRVDANGVGTMEHVDFIEIPLPDSLEVDTAHTRGLLDKLHTRIYLPEDTQAHAGDPLLSSLSEDERATLVATREADGSLRFDVRLQGEGETVFLDYWGT